MCLGPLPGLEGMDPWMVYVEELDESGTIRQIVSSPYAVESQYLLAHSYIIEGMFHSPNLAPKVRCHVRVPCGDVIGGWKVWGKQ